MNAKMLWIALTSSLFFVQAAFSAPVNSNNDEHGMPKDVVRYADDCGGDPLCIENSFFDKSTSPVYLPPPRDPVKEAKEKAAKEKAERERVAREKAEQDRAGKAAAAEAAKPKKSEGSGDGYRYSEVTNAKGDYKAEVKFNDDKLHVPPNFLDDIRGMHDREPIDVPCAELATLPAMRGDSLEKQQEGFRAALKCLDSCITDQDLEFLVSCVDWQSTELERNRCTDEQRRQAMRDGKYGGWHKNTATGECEPGALRERLTYGNITDLVFIVDNSGSMFPVGRDSVLASVKPIVTAAQELYLNANLILTTQNIGEAPEIFAVNDPGLEQKLATSLTAIYSRQGDADERELEALRKNLVEVVRPNAHLVIMVLTDEPDSSAEPVPNYLDALKKLTGGKVTISAAATPDPRVLGKAVKLTGGKYIDLNPQSVASNIRKIIEVGQDAPVVTLSRQPELDTLAIRFNDAVLEKKDFTFDPKTRALKFNFPIDLRKSYPLEVFYVVSEPAEPAAAAAAAPTAAKIPSAVPDENKLVQACKPLADEKKSSYLTWDPGERNRCSWIRGAKGVPANLAEQHAGFVKTWLQDRVAETGHEPLSKYEAGMLLSHYYDNTLAAKELDSASFADTDVVAVIAVANKQNVKLALGFLDALNETSLQQGFRALSDAQIAALQAIVKNIPSSKKLAPDEQLVAKALEFAHVPESLTTKKACDDRAKAYGELRPKLDAAEASTTFGYGRLLKAVHSAAEYANLLATLKCSTL